MGSSIRDCWSCRTESTLVLVGPDSESDPDECLVVGACLCTAFFLQFISLTKDLNDITFTLYFIISVS